MSLTCMAIIAVALASYATISNDPKPREAWKTARKSVPARAGQHQDAGLEVCRYRQMVPCAVGCEALACTLHRKRPQSCTCAHDPARRIGLAATWDTGMIGTHANHADPLPNSVEHYTSRFIEEYSG